MSAPKKWISEKEIGDILAFRPLNRAEAEQYINHPSYLVKEHIALNSKLSNTLRIQCVRNLAESNSWPSSPETKCKFIEDVFNKYSFNKFEKKILLQFQKGIDPKWINRQHLPIGNRIHRKEASRTYSDTDSASVGKTAANQHSFLTNTTELLSIQKSDEWGLSASALLKASSRNNVKLGASTLVDLNNFVIKYPKSIFLHRGMLTKRETLKSVIENLETYSKLNVQKSVRLWRKRNSLPLLRYWSNYPEARAAIKLFKELTGYLDYSKRFLVKELYITLETSGGNLRLKLDAVNLEESNLGLKGNWIITLLDPPSGTSDVLLGLGWNKLTKAIDSTTQDVPDSHMKRVRQVLYVSSHTLNGAENNIAYLLEEVLVGVCDFQIFGFKLHTIPLHEKTLQKRRDLLRAIEVRVNWRANNIRKTRGPDINNCAICGRALSRSLSVQREIGPHCWNKVARDKEVKMIDLNVDYEPYEYETGISKEMWFKFIVDAL